MFNDTSAVHVTRKTGGSPGAPFVDGPVTVISILITA